MLKKNSKSYNLFIASELLHESAGNPRQWRQLENYKSLEIPIIVLTIDSWRWRLFKPSELENKKTNLSNFGNRGRKFFLIRLMRFIKQDLMMEFFTFKAWTLYWLILKVYLSKDIKKVYISSPPFPGFSAILGFLGKNYEIDMRDPWALHPTLAKFSWARKHLEKFIFSRANIVSVATKFMAKKIFDEYKIDSRVEYNFPNTSAEEFSNPTDAELSNLDEQFKLATNDSSIKTLTYCGTTPDEFYDLTKIGNILKDALSKEYELRIFFIGTSKVFTELKDLEDEGRVNYISRVSRKESILYLRQSDFVMFFGHKFDGYLTTKIFEYMALKKRIIPIDLDEKYEAFDLIEEYGQPKSKINTGLDLINYYKQI